MKLIKKLWRKFLDSFQEDPKITQWHFDNDAEYGPWSGGY